MAGFNEREYELLYNAEFMRANSSSIVGIPSVPTTREEYKLGYDVEYKIKNGSFVYSLFLQYKISYYAEYRSGKNKHIWDCHKGPYYRFPIEKLDKTKQHNLLVDLSRKGEEVFYCAPIFVGRDKLESFAADNQIISNSRYFDPLDMGLIVDFEQHHVSCDPDGSYGFFHSDLKKLNSVNNWQALIGRLKHKEVNWQYILKLVDLLEEGIHKAYEARLSVPDNIKEIGTYSYLNYVLNRYYNLRWLIF